MKPLTESQIRLLLERLHWTPIYEDDRLVLADKTRGYSSNPEIARTQAALSLMLSVVTRATLEREAWER